MSRGFRLTRTVIAVCLAGAVHTASAAGLAPAPCVGDCDGDSRIRITDLIVAVKVVLGEAPLADCPSVDCGADPPVSCLLAAIDGAMRGGCPLPGGPPCGDAYCEIGQVCCNPLLCICAPPGEICLQ